MTTWPPLLSTAAISRSAPTRSASSSREVQVDRAALEERRSDDDVRGAGASTSTARVDRSDPAADAAGKRGADARDERVVAALAPSPRRDRSAAPSASRGTARSSRRWRCSRAQAFALDELHDAAAHEIDGRNQHDLRVLQTDRNAAARRGTASGPRPRAPKSGRLDAASAASAWPAVKTSRKCSNVPAPPEAITGIEHRGGHRGRQLAVESCARAVAIDRRQQDLAGAARLRLARPLDRLAGRSPCCRFASRRRTARPPAWRRSRRRWPGCRSGRPAG